MLLEMWLWKLEIVCNINYRRLFSVLSECTQFVVGHGHDDKLVSGAGDTE